MTLFFEGDDSTYVDNKMRLHGTGSEDYYNGGWYALLDRWDRGNSLPLHGCLDYSLPMAEPVDTVSSWPTKCPMRRKSIMEWNMVK